MNRPWGSADHQSLNNIHTYIQTINSFQEKSTIYSLSAVQFKKKEYEMNRINDLIHYYVLLSVSKSAKNHRHLESKI